MYTHIYQHIQLYCIHYTVHTYLYTTYTHIHTYIPPMHTWYTYTLISYSIPIQIVTQQIVHPYICTCLYSPYSIYTTYYICHLLYIPMLYVPPIIHTTCNTTVYMYQPCICPQLTHTPTIQPRHTPPLIIGPPLCTHLVCTHSEVYRAIYT